MTGKVQRVRNMIAMLRHADSSLIVAIAATRHIGPWLAIV